MNKGGGFAYKSHSAEVGIGDVKEAEELGCEEGSVQRFFHYSAPLLHIADTHLSLSLPLPLYLLRLCLPAAFLHFIHLKPKPPTRSYSLIFCAPRFSAAAIVMHCTQSFNYFELKLFNLGFYKFDFLVILFQKCVAKPLFLSYIQPGVVIGGKNLMQNYKSFNLIIQHVW